MNSTAPRPAANHPKTLGGGLRTRLKTATSATQGWAQRLKSRLEDARVVRTLGDHR